MRKIVTALLALLVLTFGLCGRVSAAEPRGSITFVMEFDEEALEGGSLTLYRVGQISADGHSFVPVEALGEDAPVLVDLWDPELAKELHDLAAGKGLEPSTAAIENGRAIFSDLETGLYVVCQRSGEETPGYAAIDPFLISLPQWRDDTYVYDLTAAPKVPLVPVSTEPTDSTEPTEPDTPNLPQTGQLNWPVPIMTVLGLAFFCLGWGLLGSKRRDA